MLAYRDSDRTTDLDGGVDGVLVVDRGTKLPRQTGGQERKRNFRVDTIVQHHLKRTRDLFIHVVDHVFELRSTEILRLKVCVECHLRTVSKARDVLATTTRTERGGVYEGI